jgi:hypothetical protein
LTRSSIIPTPKVPISLTFSTSTLV